RMFLLRLEQQMQRILDNPSVGLPYWNWTVDGRLPPDEQAQTPLWTAEGLGEARGDVTSGPLGGMRVRLVGFGTQLWSVAPRPLQRSAGTDQVAGALPTVDEARRAFDTILAYDAAPWDVGSDGFRNRVEGWIDPLRPGQVSAPQMHNRVHVWVGGDM